ncbi:enhancer of polycomb-like-domain-containing protein [Suillus cothurnatus]|nr:enhancer of polycomb-like-domain-containing protein [Suillus cothurnatus]
MPRNPNLGTSTLRNRNRVTNKTRLKVIQGSIDADPLVVDEDEEKARIISTAGVDAEDANEHHLQAVLSAASHRHQSVGRSTRGEKAVAPAAYIPTPDSTGIVDNYDELYPSQRWEDPGAYIRSSETVDEAVSNALVDAFTYYMDERDKEWLDRNNEEARGEGTSAQGALSASGATTRSGLSQRSAKAKGKEPESTQPLAITEDEFELVMGIFEKGLESGMAFPPFTDYQEAFSSPLPPSMFATFTVPTWIPQPALLLRLAKVIYPYWRDRRIERKGHRIIPILNFDESDVLNESYICFRRREIKAIRKTRASQATSSDKLLRLQNELTQGLELAKTLLSRENLKRDYTQQTLQVWDKRFEFAELKRKFPSLGTKEDEELLLDKERVVKKPKIEPSRITGLKIRNATIDRRNAFIQRYGIHGDDSTFTRRRQAFARRMDTIIPEDDEEMSARLRERWSTVSAAINMAFSGYILEAHVKAMQPPSAIPQMRISSNGAMRPPVVGKITSPSSPTVAQQSSPPRAASTNGVNGNHTGTPTPDGDSVRLIAAPNGIAADSTTTINGTVHQSTDVQMSPPADLSQSNQAGSPARPKAESQYASVPPLSSYQIPMNGFPHGTVMRQPSITLQQMQFKMALAQNPDGRPAQVPYPGFVPNGTHFNVQLTGGANLNNLNVKLPQGRQWSAIASPHQQPAQLNEGTPSPHVTPGNLPTRTPSANGMRTTNRTGNINVPPQVGQLLPNQHFRFYIHLGGVRQPRYMVARHMIVYALIQSGLAKLKSFKLQLCAKSDEQVDFAAFLSTDFSLRLYYPYACSKRFYIKALPIIDHSPIVQVFPAGRSHFAAE